MEAGKSKRPRKDTAPLKLEVIQVRVSQATLAKLEKLAADDQRSLSGLCRIWIEDRLQKEGK